MTMTPERWQTVKALFHEALDQPSDERLGWLAVSTHDADLRSEVESLLAALREDDGRFDQSAGVSLNDLARESSAVIPGVNDRVGPYRLVREVGQGGMGIVYEAYRDDDQYRKRVAIKTISRGMNSDVILRRFRRERQIVARLEHANIARLLDGGVTDSGQPYFALEYVEGRPIDDYCDAKGLPPRERLQLFAQVCGAVQYAHASLVVHRDLKPSNILVTDDGTVKLLDFGIAKLLRDDDADAADGLTQTGLVPLTSSYASPEQVASGAVTTATDVFSLGIVLYKLLAGRHPFAHDRPTSEETRRRIAETTPPPPSAVAAAAGDGRLQRVLRDDLDSIVLMALRKEPARRYASIEALGEDVARYLSGRPVSARPDSAGYRIRKFVRRNRTAVAAGTAAALALVAGLTTTVWQAEVARRERDRARLEQSKAERISLFLQNMLGAADPSWYSPTERPGPQTTIGTIFDAAARRAETELAAEPDVLAGVLRTLGMANQALRRIDRATPQLERARELHARLLGPASRDVAIDETELGMARIGAGDYPGAERWIRQSIEHFRAAGDTLSDEWGRAVGNLGLALASSGRAAEAEPWFRRSLTHRQRFDSSSGPTAILLGNIGLVFSVQGKLDSAEFYYRQALAIYDRSRPREFFEEGFTLGNLAVDLIIRGRPVEAESLAQKQIEHFSRLLGPAHQNVVYGWVNLARARHASGNQTGALEAVTRAEAILMQIALPAGHPDHARTEYVRGQIASSQGQFVEGERRLRNAVAIRRARLAPGSMHTADAESALGALLARTGRHAEAESLLVNAFRAYRAMLDPSDPRTPSTRRLLISLCETSQRPTACAYRDTAGPGGAAGPR